MESLRDKCKKIFERFEKLDDFVQGTGLGLSVCQIISEQLKGSLSVDVSYKGRCPVCLYTFNEFNLKPLYETDESIQ